MYIRTHTHTQAQTHTCTHTRTRIHTHTNTAGLLRPGPWVPEIFLLLVWEFRSLNIQSFHAGTVRPSSACSALRSLNLTSRLHGYGPKNTSPTPGPLFLALEYNSICTAVRCGCNSIRVQKVAPSLFRTGVGDAQRWQDSYAFEHDMACSWRLRWSEISERCWQGPHTNVGFSVAGSRKSRPHYR